MVEKHGYISLDECINSYIDRTEQSLSKFFKLWQIAYSGMSEIGLQLFFEVKSVKLPVNANQTVNLPADFQNYTKVGVLNGAGEIVDLHFNSKLTYFADNLPTRASQTIDNTLYQYYNWQSGCFYNYWNGTGYNNWYGVPSGGVPAGSFNLDRTNNILLLGEGYTNIFDYVMVEYIATPAPENGQYFVPQVFRETIISWITWQDANSRPAASHFNLGDKRDKRHEYYNNRRLALAAFKPFHLWEAYQWNATSTRLTVKT